MWKLHHRENGTEGWWFASIAIPLLAATIGPFANVLSIAALVSYWREDLVDPYTGATLAQLTGRKIKDPRWATALNVASLVTGYVGNFFLFCNFTQRIRYLIALPVTVFLWFVSAFLLVGITIGMAVACPPKPVIQSYTQAYWYAVIAAVLYSLCSIILLVNMLGYFLGRYGQHFVLTYAQRTLILQTFLFFIWLAGGAGVFNAVEGWDFSNALYFCDVTILTIGFGDLTPHFPGGRALVIPYATGGIVFLGLMVTSISNFAKELGHAKVVRARFDKKRIRTLERSNTLEASMYIEGLRRTSGSRTDERGSFSSTRPHPNLAWPKRSRSMRPERPKQRQRRLSLVLLREEKDRFNAMRRIQENNARFKKYTVLISSIVAFFALWLIGAVVFWQVEKHTSSEINSFYDGFYFCYVSLITVGYGDLTPTSSAGRPFFVVWSLFAVPSVTILISSAGNTVVETFNKGTNRVADFTLLPQHGIWRNFLNQHPWLLLRLQKRATKIEQDERIQEGFKVGPDPAENGDYEAPTLEEIVGEETKKPSVHELARRLAHSIRHVADDTRQHQDKRYAYEEWVEFTELIRFTSGLRDDDDEEEDEGLINWDWIGEDSPMMAEQTEPEWLLDRLSESMVRYIRHQAPGLEQTAMDAQETVERSKPEHEPQTPNRQINFFDGTRVWREREKDVESARGRDESPGAEFRPITAKYQ